MELIEVLLKAALKTKGFIFILLYFHLTVGSGSESTTSCVSQQPLSVNVYFYLQQILITVSHCYTASVMPVNAMRGQQVLLLCESALPSLILTTDSETLSSRPHTPSNLDSLFSSPSPDRLQSPRSETTVFSSRWRSRFRSSRRSLVSSVCSVTSNWILSSSEMILSLVFPVRGWRGGGVRLDNPHVIVVICVL